MRWIALAAVIVVASGPAAAEREPVRLRLGTMAIDGSRYMKDILALSEEIEKRTRGSVQLDWVSGGQLGEEAAMAEAIQKGKLDGGGFSETGLTALVPDMAAWRSPGLFHDYAEVDRATAALDASVKESFAKQKLVFAMWADLGFAQVFSTESIGTLRDAVKKAEPWLAASLDGKLTEAITSGTARAWAVPPLYMLAIGTAKAKFMTNLRYRYVVGGLVFAGRGWAKLSADDQATVLAVCRDWESKIRASWRKETERGISALAKAGVTMRAAPEAQVVAFVDELATASAAARGDLGAAIAAAARPR